jgi:hypothetical protein
LVSLLAGFWYCWFTGFVACWFLVLLFEFSIICNYDSLTQNDIVLVLVHGSS